MCGAAITRVSLLVLIFGQGVVPANNSTILCVTIVDVERILHCGRVEKRPHVRKHFKNAFELKYIHRRADDVNQTKIVKNFKQNWS